MEASRTGPVGNSRIKAAARCGSLFAQLERMFCNVLLRLWPGGSVLAQANAASGSWVAPVGPVGWGAAPRRAARESCLAAFGPIPWMAASRFWPGGNCLARSAAARGSDAVHLLKMGQ